MQRSLTLLPSYLEHELSAIVWLGTSALGVHRPAVAGAERGLDAVMTNHCVEVMFSKCATQVCKMKFGSLHHYLGFVSI